MSGPRLVNETAKYQFKIMGEESPPVTGSQLTKLRQIGTIQDDTLIRELGGDEWVSADMIEWLAEVDSLPLAAEHGASDKQQAKAAATGADETKKADGVRQEEEKAPRARRGLDWETPSGPGASRVAALGAGLSLALAITFWLGFWAGATYGTRPQAKSSHPPQSASGPEPERPNRDQPEESPAVRDPPEAVAQLKRLGGQVHIDYEDPQNPVDMVTFTGPKITSAAIDPIQELTRLQEVKLIRTEVTDSGMVAVGRSRQLRRLSLLGSGQITDAGVEELKGLSELQELSLASTRVTDAGIAHLRGLSHLEALDLSGTRVTDAGLAHLAGLAQLQTLTLQGTGISNAGLAHLGQLSLLHRLNLDNTRVSDAGLAHLKGLSKLRQLFVRRTGVTATGIQELKTALPQVGVD